MEINISEDMRKTLVYAVKVAMVEAVTFRDKAAHRAENGRGMKAQTAARQSMQLWDLRIGDLQEALDMLKGENQ